SCSAPRPSAYGAWSGRTARAEPSVEQPALRATCALVDRKEAGVVRSREQAHAALDQLVTAECRRAHHRAGPVAADRLFPVSGADADPVERDQDVARGKPRGLRGAAVEHLRK